MRPSRLSDLCKNCLPASSLLPVLDRVPYFCLSQGVLTIKGVFGLRSSQSDLTLDPLGNPTRGGDGPVKGLGEGGALRAQQRLVLETVSHFIRWRV